MFIILASIVSACCDATGDDSSDAQVKIRRLVNEKGPGFCKIADWPFMHTDISFAITSTSYIYSGASYIPASFQRIISANLKDSNDSWFPLTEVGLKERYQSWLNPSDNASRPNEFCITGIESSYYEIQFNHIPDGDYTFYASIDSKWVNVVVTAGTIIVTDDYYEAFTHYISMARARQQGDLELYGILKSEWWNPGDPKGCILGNLLSFLSPSSKQKGARPLEPRHSKSDYSSRG